MYSFERVPCRLTFLNAIAGAAAMARMTTLSNPVRKEIIPTSVMVATAAFGRCTMLGAGSFRFGNRRTDKFG
jgi:hypothetical protein